jgi:hypothetical protein
MLSAKDNHNNIFFKNGGLSIEDKVDPDPFKEHGKSGSVIGCDE